MCPLDTVVLGVLEGLVYGGTARLCQQTVCAYATELWKNQHLLRMPFQTLCIADALVWVVVWGNPTWISSWSPRRWKKRQDATVFVSCSDFLLTFLHRTELVGLTNSARSRCGDFIRSLQPSHYQRTQSQQIDKVRSLESDPTKTYFQSSRYRGCWYCWMSCVWSLGSARTWPGIWSSCHLLSSRGFQDQGCERTAWKTRLHFPRFWSWTSAKGMLSVSSRLLWLLVMNIIIAFLQTFVFAEPFLCWGEE